MQAFIARYYYTISLSLLAILLGVVFYAGFLEGKTVTQQPVVLACSDNVLDKLSIPTNALASGSPTQAASAVPTAPEGAMYMGSKNGTKYYLPTCSAAKRIKPANYLWFQSAEDAQIQGYSQGSC